MSSDPWDSIPPRQLLVVCPACEKPTTATERGAIQDSNSRVGVQSLYSLLECNSCGGPLLVAQEDYGDGWDEPFRLWPLPARILSQTIPESLRRELSEARACFDSKAYTAAVVMVRRTLEGVCAENQVTKKPLYKALQEMASQGLLDGRLLTWADGLRVLGNEGAHYTGLLVSREDAKDALAFAEAVLDYLYVLTAQFDEFQQRRKGQSNTPDSSLSNPRRSSIGVWKQIIRLNARASAVVFDWFREMVYSPPTSRGTFQAWIRALCKRKLPLR